MKVWKYKDEICEVIENLKFYNLIAEMETLIYFTFGPLF